MNLLFLTLKAFNSAYNQSYVAKLFAIVLAFFAPLANYVHFLILLLVVDAFTSIYYQAKQSIEIEIKGGKRSNSIIVFFRTIESSKLRTTIEKLVSYLIWLIICFMFDKIVFKLEPLQGSTFNYFSISNIAVLMMCSTELTSITANMSKITKNPIYKQIMSIFKKRIDEKLNHNDE